MNNEFDCVKMKRKAAKIIHKNLSQLSFDEELDFWAEKSKSLKKSKTFSIRKLKKEKSN